MFFEIDDTSKPFCFVVVSRPAAASVDTLGLSTRATSGRLGDAVVRSFTVSPVLDAVRLMVTPTVAAQASTAFAHVEVASRSGYGSHRVKVPPLCEVADGVPPDVELQAAREPIRAAVAMIAPATRSFFPMLFTMFLLECIARFSDGAVIEPVR